MKALGPVLGATAFRASAARVCLERRRQRSAAEPCGSGRGKGLTEGTVTSPEAPACGAAGRPCRCREERWASPEQIQLQCGALFPR